MKIIYKNSQNEHSTRANADALVSPAGLPGLFARAFRQVIGWLASGPTAVNPGMVRSLAYVRINSQYDALGRS